MSQDDTLLELKELATSKTLLYVEDNEGLRKKAGRLFKSFFGEVTLASDGKEGLELFKETNPDVIITDIQMPNMDGLEMSIEIKKINPHAKIIVTSAYNDVEYLHQAIDIGVYKYVVKPMPINELSVLLIECIKNMNYEKTKTAFDNYLQNIFHATDDLIILFENSKMIQSNNNFLEFFKLKEFDDYKNVFSDFGEILLPHFSFLYNHDKIDWFDEISKNYNRPYNIKISDNDGQERHFILKFHQMEDGLSVLILNDITQLNLMQLFVDKTDLTSSANKFENIDKEQLSNLLIMAKDNKLQIDAYNYYKGLVITHPCVIRDVRDDGITISSSYSQQKAIHYEQQVILSSEVFPVDYICSDIKEINFDKQSVKLGEGRLIEESPSMRQAVRIEPANEHTCRLFHHKHKFDTDISILDISLRSIQLSMLSLPTGFKVDDGVKLDILFSEENISIECDSKVLKINEHKDYESVVLSLEPSHDMNLKLIDYISKRQMSLIREFKDKQYAL